MGGLKDMAMVKAGTLTLNPAFVVSMDWDRRHYMNGPGDSTLVVMMHDGREHRIKHTAHLLDGVDAYKVEEAITAAHAALTNG